MGLVRRGTRGAAYLVLGAGGAALLGWLIYAFTISVQGTSGQDRVFVIALAGVAVAVAGFVLLSPPVRDAEVAMARPLLGVELPAVRDRYSWDSRWHGAAWAGLVLVVGALAAVVLLSGVPGGVGLAAGRVSDGAELVWRVPLGIVIVLGSFAAQAVFGGILVWAAPRVLGPTTADKLALAAEREQELARSNELARELHDTIGHSLTAISVQAEAGSAVGPTDPQVALGALERISASASAALQELDEVLGSLRTGGGGRTAADLAALVHRAATSEPSSLRTTGEWASLSAARSGDVFRIVQEGLTNAVKHGKGAAVVHVAIDSDVEIKVMNMTAEQRDSPIPGGRGLVGLRERAELAGGTVDVGPRSGGKEWQLCVRLPNR